MANFTTTSYQDVLQSSMGQNGAVLLTANVTLNGNYKCIVPIGDVTLTSIDCNMTYNNTSTQVTAANIGTLEDGKPFFANIASVRLATGKAYVYA